MAPYLLLGRCPLFVAKEEAMTNGAKDLFLNVLSPNFPKGAPQLVSLEKIKRPAGYQIPGFVALGATIRYGNLKAQGFGEGPEALAISKALSEATERVVQKLYSLRTQSPESSNGWACHVSSELAVQSAILELIERDVAITNWESNGPFFEIPQTLWPPELKTWLEMRHPSQEYSSLRLFLSQNDNGACISALLFNDRLNFVAGHASGLDLKAVILSATAECMRAAHAALRFENFVEVAALHASGTTAPAPPGAHSLAYAYSKPLPSNLRLLKATEEEFEKMWSRHLKIVSKLDHSKLYIQVYPVADLFVARVRSNQYRPIHWGTKHGEKATLNPNPHFVG